MKLSKLLKNLNYSLVNGTLDIDINELKYDSRKVQKNDVFIALNGFNSDGHDYIPEAINKGAKVIVVKKMVAIHGDVTILKVDDTRVALAIMSANYFENPRKNLTLIGITGTTGKTTTTHIVKELLDASNIKCGLIGSIGIKYNDKVIKTDNTTPESYELHKIFNDMVKSGITHVVMECSSQAYKLNRLYNLTFDIGVLTNITHDHIGPFEHENQKEYLKCKKQLFLNSKKIIVNNDSKYLTYILKDIKNPIISYGIKEKADIKASHIKFLNTDDFIGSEFLVKGLITNKFKVSLPGLFNVYNTLCALSVIKVLDIDLGNIKEALLKISVRGRMEIALIKPNYKVIIDYAHTIDGMESLVKTLKAYKPKRLISIYGAGGNRDKNRRYKLGEIIGGASDLSILTMDNPRFEEISAINNDIKVGLNKVGAKYIEIDNRSEAIKYACENALEGDLILLIGKGHENYQDIKGIKYYFNELDVLKNYK